MVGRKRKLSSKMIDKVCRYLSEGQTVRVACTLAGLGQSTYFRWLDITKDPYNKLKKEFRDRIKTALVDAEARMVLIVQVAAIKNWTAAAWYLERHNPADWGKKIQATITDDRKSPIKIKGATLEEMMQVKKILENGNGNGNGKRIIEAGTKRQTSRISDN